MRRDRSRDGDHGGSTGQRRVVRRVGLPSGRAVVGGLLMAVAATGTFLAYSSAADDDAIAVVIAARDLHAGDVLGPDDLATVAVALPDDVRGLFGSPETVLGRQMVAAVGAGEFLQASAASRPIDGDESLEVAILVPPGRAVDDLVAGDRVDVFSTWGDVTELIAVDARVLEASGSGPAGRSEHLLVRLAVARFGQVEALVHAQAAGDITVIRAALGTETGDVGRVYRPLAGAHPRPADLDGSARRGGDS